MGEVDAEIGSKADDLGFGQAQERRVDFYRIAVNTDASSEPCGVCEALNELRSAIGVATVIDGIDSDVDAFGVVDFGHRGSEREEHQVPCWDVRDRDIRRHFSGRTALGDGDVVGKGGSPEDAEIEL